MWDHKKQITSEKNKPTQISAKSFLFLINIYISLYCVQKKRTMGWQNPSRLRLRLALQGTVLLCILISSGFSNAGECSYS